MFSNIKNGIYNNKYISFYHILQDALLASQTSSHLRKALAAKTSSLQQLNNGLLGAPFSNVVTYGSIASAFGSVGQSSYAAANAVLEGAACGMRARGLPTVNVSWGAWGGIGMAVSDATIEQKLKSSGVSLMEPASGLTALWVIMRSHTNPHSATVLVADLLWSRLLSSGRDSLHFYSEMGGAAQTELQEQKQRNQRAAVEQTRDAKLPGFSSAGLKTHQQRTADLHLDAPAPLDVAKVVEQTLESILGRHVSRNEPLVAAGLDSIGTVEVQTRLERATRVHLPPTLVFDYPTMDAIVDYLRQKLATSRPNQKDKSVDELEYDLKEPKHAGEVDDHDPAGSVLPLMLMAQAQQLAGEPSIIVAVTPEAPKLSKHDYFTVPSIRRLQRMSAKELSQVPRFVIGRAGVGEIAFLYPVDLRGAELDSIVSIKHGNISVYPSNPVSPGAGLNQPALLTFKKIFPRGGKSSRTQRAAFTAVLLRACVRIGATFVHYDEDEGVWIVKTDAFI